ncbi:hypothetical protein FD754_019900 [Muntiacus muntjak]|uniref:BAG domain-containing protein n=1 Tax=Muntiacus muntjak TaxID=9888 RepID=A0A5N3V1G1_MUNMU|nr:hypothetical protein FD754_019900 [Muntiacus muntjak]
MSAVRRSGYRPSDRLSYGRYYGPGGGDVPVHPPPPIYPPPPPRPEPGGARGRPSGDHLASGGAWSEPGHAGGGHQEQPPYPSYNSNYWNSAARPRAPYPSTGNANFRNTASYPGAYYYTPGYAQTNYSTEVPSTYPSPGNSPTPVSCWMYPQQDCQTEAPPLRGQVPGYPASQNPGMNVPRPTARAQEDSWAPPGAYEMGTRGSSQPLPSPPPPQPKDSSYAYSQADQGMSRHNFPCSVHQYESLGSVNDDSSELLYSQVQYNQGNHPAEECLSSDQGTPPGMKKTIHVLEKVQYLEQEVEEFAGKKTDKAYWFLEEMLTKELLELDSVETGGQDSIWQVRKEVVCKIQATLEKLGKKGL